MKTIKVLSTLFALMLLPLAANAVPTLQIDCDPCEYDSVHEDSVATTPVFELGFIVTNEGNNDVFEDYEDFWVSIALVGEFDGSEDVGDINAIFGALLIGGESLDDLYGAGNWTAYYGAPPSDALTPPGSNVLAGHSIFDTWYVEVLLSDGSLNWTGEGDCATYDVQDDVGFVDFLGAGSFCATIEIDRSGIPSDYGLHFDFYTTVDEGDYRNLGIKAPFSHDVSSVPEPGTLSLLGLGLLALGLGRRRREIA